VETSLTDLATHPTDVTTAASRLGSDQLDVIIGNMLLLRPMAYQELRSR